MEPMKTKNPHREAGRRLTFMIGVDQLLVRIFGIQLALGVKNTANHDIGFGGQGLQDRLQSWSIFKGDAGAAIFGQDHGQGLHLIGNLLAHEIPLTAKGSQHDQQQGKGAGKQHDRMQFVADWKLGKPFFHRALQYFNGKIEE